MQQLTRLILFFFMALNCFACSHVHNKSWVSSDSAPPLLLSDAIINRLVEQYPPAKTTITLIKSSNKAFDAQLEKQARQAGYAVSQEDKAVRVSYVIDIIEGSTTAGTGYLHLKTNDGFSFGQTFRLPGYELANIYTQNEVEK